MNDLTVDSRLKACDESFEWCVRRAKADLRTGNLEQAARWCEIAGRLAETFGHSFFSNNGIESVVGILGRSIGAPAEASSYQAKDENSHPANWLHVLTEAYSTGGHTALCRRWIECDSSSDLHSALITNQEACEADPALQAVIKNRRGNLTFLDAKATLLSRAIKLREYSRRFDVVVLHIHMWDPIAPIAFGVSGGPIVLFVNHADHLYWIGASIADLVLNIRPSGEILCDANRGCNRLARLPLPLSAQAPLKNPHAKTLAKLKLGFRNTEIVFLTVGSAYKFEPTKDISFFETAKKLLEAVPNARVIAVGPSPNDKRWRELHEATAGKATAVGRQLDLSIYFDAADIYLEGFPFGSLTALLEAGLMGLPVVLAPACCPLPFRSDDFGLEMTPPRDDFEYIFQAKAFANNAKLRISSGLALRSDLHDWHCGDGWNSKLHVIRNTALHLGEHRTWIIPKISPLPKKTLHFWIIFAIQRTAGDDPFSFVLRNSMLHGLKTTPDARLISAMIKPDQSIRIWLRNLFLIASAIALSILPVSLARKLFTREMR